MRAQLAFVVGALVVAGCEDKRPPAPPPPPPVPVDAVVVDAAEDGWARCKRALDEARTAPATRRVGTILAGCAPCGDWKPILEWQLFPSDGGADRRRLEEAMGACEAWCDASAKQAFMGALDDARAKETRTPWRRLGEQCKDAVSAGADARYMSAPWFALDRVARWVAKQPNGAAALDGITLVLPPVSLTGIGFVLAEAPVVKPAAPTLHVSVSATELTVGALPVGTLGATGIVVSGGVYPGDVVAPPALAARLAGATGPIALFAPAGLPAARVVVAVKAAREAPLQLAARATSSVVGWSAYGVIPIALGSKVDAAGTTITLGATPDAALEAIKAAGPGALTAAPPTLRVAKDATVAGLAQTLGALAYFEVTRVTLVGPGS